MSEVQFPKISIIVPVYNTENYLRECLDSIIAQTFTDFEVILVDDGSTDESGKICDLYAKNDTRIKVIHKINEGVSIARNTALNIVKGEYICFIDSDDTVEKDMLNSHLKTINDYNADIVFSDREICNVDSKVKSLVCFNQREARIHFFQTGLLRPSLWLCIFRTNLFERLKFPSHIVHWEDYAIMACLLNKARTVVLTSKRFYNYRMRTGGATSKTINKKMMTCFSIDDFLQEHKIYINNQERIDVNSFFIKFGCFETFRDINSEYTSLIRKKAFTNIKTIFLSKSIRNKTKVILLIYIISPHLAMWLSKLYKKIIVK